MDVGRMATPMKYLSDQISLRLDTDRCAGCGLCETVCPHGVFLVEKGKARIQDREACIECGACARNCPADAIFVASGVGCAEAIINGLLTGKETCCDGSECCSSKPKDCHETDRRAEVQHDG